MLNINGINKGIVIDHVKPNYGIKIFNFLNLDKANYQVALIMNVTSKKMGKKDIIKIENIIDLDLDILSLINENITINIIENDVIIKKYHPQIPKTITNIIKCKNPRCITSIENTIVSKFNLVNKKTNEYCCEYCEEIIKLNNLEN